MNLFRNNRVMVVDSILWSVNVMAKPRPLSPHLQIYRLPLPALMSISHRLSGVVLSTGTVLVAVWLMMLAAGEISFELAQSAVGHPLG
ncbi:MAG: succinate dehydrogenase, cytochrome b556 subunit, partial [Alphaproteobacteria bacterium]|nr:succinate dehydrogenase, cytochrome b556 subunit [Alphaproteobacteria bacterium]